MILIALVTHILGHKLPLWLTSQKMSDIRAKGGLKQIYFELSGVIFDFIIAFIILTIVGLTTKEEYLLNKNILYGLTFNQTAKDLGFKDGDKIISVDEVEIIEFDDISEYIVGAKGDVTVSIKRITLDTTIVLSDNDKIELYKDGSFPISPRLITDSAGFLRNNLTFNERQRSLTESFEFFPKTVKIFFQLFVPWDEEKGGAITLVSYLPLLHQIGYTLILFGFLNLLPIPGLDVGNTFIALIEAIRKRKYNPKWVRNLRYVCIGIISVLILFIFLSSQI